SPSPRPNPQPWSNSTPSNLASMQFYSSAISKPGRCSSSSTRRDRRRRQVRPGTLLSPSPVPGSGDHQGDPAHAATSHPDPLQLPNRQCRGAGTPGHQGSAGRQGLQQPGLCVPGTPAPPGRTPARLPGLQLRPGDGEPGPAGGAEPVDRPGPPASND